MELNKKDVAENRYIAAVSYIPVLFIVPLLAKKDSHFAQFHAKQGMLLTITWFIIWILGSIPIIGWFIIMPLGNLLMVVISILGILNALAGKYWKIPYLSQYADKIKL